ncbi:MAG: DMT family transporter [Lysobacteraceae bacterium]|jgi:drug/metabolite transporter (DMT)-like permease|nr:DMT family transporter [Xanthomonadaceae bacterium]MCZ8319127.1 DMT family transporter [Silanimonas sp.]
MPATRRMGLGELLSLLSAAAWAVGVILYRQLGATLPPLQLNLLKNLLVMGMVAIAVPLVHGFALPAFTAAQVAIAMASGVIGIAIADTLYFRALNQLGAGRMGVLGNFYSPAVIVLSVLFLDERLTLVQLVGFGLVSLGVFLVAERRPDDAGNGRDLLRGLAIGFIAILLMAVAIVMVKRTLEAQPLLWVTGLRMGGAVLGLLVLSMLVRRGLSLLPAASTVPWRKLVAAAFVGQFLSMVLWLGGYKFTSASVAAILNESSSVFILLLAWAWLKEPLTRRAVAGVALTIAGVACMLLPH